MNAKERKSPESSDVSEFRAEMDRRLASLDRGEGIDAETVFARLRERSEQRRRELREQRDRD